MPARRHQPQFGGVLDAVSGVIGAIDSNRFVELISTDIIGMCFPRTMIEAKKRGPDAARETAIRELSGLVGNMFLVGWFSHLFLKALGNRVNAYNPTGIPVRAWMSADSLQAFGKLYEDIVRDGNIHNPQKARELFIRRVLTGLESADRHLGNVALSEAAKVLDGKAKDDYLKGIGRLAQEGRLSNEAIEQLVRYFELKDTGAVADVVGINRFNEQARQLAASAQKHNQRLHLSDKFDEALEYVKARMRLSHADLKHAEKQFVHVVDREALTGGLSKTVNLYGPDGTLLAGEKSRDTVLRELKHFLEQYVDRAAEVTDEAIRKGDWKEQVLNKLFAKSKKGGLLARFIPQLDDGLVASTLKSKWAYSWIPLVMAICSSMGVAFYNNWLTRKKYGGKNVSPYELGLAQQMGTADALMGKGKQANAPQASALAAASAFTPASSSLRRYNGAFSQFQRQHGLQGGFIG